MVPQHTAVTMMWTETEAAWWSGRWEDVLSTLERDWGPTPLR